MAMVYAPGGVALDTAKMPAHVAIIMEGNRRWARSRGLPTIEGHRRGIVALREVTRAAGDWGISILTVLLDRHWFFVQDEIRELHRSNARVNVVGRFDELPEVSRAALQVLVDETRANDGLLLNLAVNYSARAEVRDAIRALAEDVRAGRVDQAEIDDERIAAYLYTGDLPDPDILIRPGGEGRLSNFLLYQVAYTELYMTDVYWPDFDRDHFALAIADFQKRQRRFGGT
jgi:undecaprenyl diphosphate synthase